MLPRIALARRLQIFLLTAHRFSAARMRRPPPQIRTVWLWCEQACLRLCLRRSEQYGAPHGPPRQIRTVWSSAAAGERGKTARALAKFPVPGRAPPPQIRKVWCCPRLCLRRSAQYGEMWGRRLPRLCLRRSGQYGAPHGPPRQIRTVWSSVAAGERGKTARALAKFPVPGRAPPPQIRTVWCEQACLPLCLRRSVQYGAPHGPPQKIRTIWSSAAAGGRGKTARAEAKFPKPAPGRLSLAPTCPVAAIRLRRGRGATSWA